MNQKIDRCWILTGACLVALIIFLSLWQGANWDEPWLMQRTQALLRGDPIPPFKPFSGFLLVPVVVVGGEYYAGRILFFGFQVLLGWGLFRLLPRQWSTLARTGAVLVLWLEPTFRERALELRTDGPSLALLACLTPWAPKLLKDSRLWPILVFLPVLVFGILVAPKLGMWAVPWWLLLPMSLPQESRKEAWIRMLKINCGILIVGLVTAGALAFASSSLRLFLVSLVSATLAPLGGQLVVLPPVTSLYLHQTLRLGWPFWVLAIAGVVRLLLVREEWRAGNPLLLWELSGWAAAAATLFYSSAFSYHFLGVAAGVWPSVLRSLRWLHARWGQPALVWFACVVAAMLIRSLIPVLCGPSLQEQSRVMALAQSYLSPWRGYVDGVGWFPRPQSAPFVTAQVMVSGGARDLWKIWERDHVAVFVLNGRTEQLMNKENIDWVREHFVQIHRNLLIPGRVMKADGQATFTWDLHLEGRFQFLVDNDSTWTLDGSALQGKTNRRDLKSGMHTLTSSGRGNLVIVLVTNELPIVSASLNNFFLPFQR